MIMFLRTLIAILIIIKTINTFEISRKWCNFNIEINNEYFIKTNIYETEDAYPTDAHFDIFGNLFYVESGKNNDGFYFNAKVIKAGEDKSRTIEGLPEGRSYSVAVDSKDHKVYFGTKSGIFSFNYESCSASRVSEKNLTLNMIFVDKDGNKYITESNNGVEELYLLDGKKKIRFHTLEALNELAIDNKNNFFFINEEKIFVLRNTLTTPVFIGNVTYDGIAQINFYKDKVFVASKRLMYFHKTELENLKEIKDIPDKVTAIAFDDRGNFVIGIKGKIVKYRKTECYIRDNENKINKHFNQNRT